MWYRIIQKISKDICINSDYVFEIAFLSYMIIGIIKLYNIITSYIPSYSYYWKSINVIDHSRLWCFIRVLLIEQILHGISSSLELIETATAYYIQAMLRCSHEIELTGFLQLSFFINNAWSLFITNMSSATTKKQSLPQVKWILCTQKLSCKINENSMWLTSGLHN